MELEFFFSDTSDRPLGHVAYRSSEGWSLSSSSYGDGSAFTDPISNVTAANYTCNPLLEDGNLHDGRIPQILGLTIGVWVILIIAFLVLRYCASEYSRAALATSNQWITALYNRKKNQSDLVSGEDERQHSYSTLLYEDKHWYTWIINFFYRLKNSDIQHRCGPDASLYLSLLRYVILLLCIFSVLSLGIILPINYFGGDLADAGFPRTTVSNIPSTSGVLWVHTVFSLIYLCIIVVVMIHFSLRLGKHQQDYSSHTVMVQWIPDVVHREDIMQHLQEALPNAPIADIQMAYDVSKITKLSEKLSSVSERLDCVDSVHNELGIRESTRVGWTKICCCTNSYDVDAKSYHEEALSNMKRELEHEKAIVRDKKRLNIGFVSFKKKKDARKFVNSYKICRRKPTSSMFHSVRASRWWVSVAPFPLDILWENLSVKYALWWLRWLLINAVLFVVLFFFSTPSIIVATIDQIRASTVDTFHIGNTTTTIEVNQLFKLYFSSLLLLLFASILPFVVSRSSYLEAHWTKSFREQTIMRKTYIFLVLMVITLPSIGLTSLNALAQLSLRGEKSITDRLHCVYLPNNGAYFVGYVIIATFIGTAVEVLRVPELVVYFYRRIRARTRIEKELALKKAAQYDFMYGVQYAWNLVIFNLVMTYSLTTPIIVPFGVLYFILKYYTDRYNIFYVYRPSSFNGRQFLHRSAINFVILGGVHLQLSTLFFSVIRLGRLDPRTVILMVTFTLTCIACIGVMFFGWFRHLLPKLRVKMGKEYRVFSSLRAGGSQDMEDEEDEREQVEVIAKGSYIPPVLRESPPQSPVDNSVTGYGYQSFGSTDRMGRSSPTSTGSGSASPPSKINDSQRTLRAPNKASTLERSVAKAKQLSTVAEPGKGELVASSSKFLV